MRSWLAVIALSSAVTGCATYSDELNRAQSHYQRNEYEVAIAGLRALEPDLDSFGPSDRARYAYLHGMTAYRLAQRPEARHWLAIARALDAKPPGLLDPQWRDRLVAALADLDRDIGSGPGAPAPVAAPDPGMAPPPPAPTAPPTDMYGRPRPF